MNGMTAFTRGPGKVSPDDGRGFCRPWRRLSGRARRQGGFARRRHWGRGAPESTAGEGVEGMVKIQVVEIRRPSLSQVAVVSRGRRRVPETPYRVGCH